MVKTMKNKKLKLIIDLMLSFIKIGAFTFGGGYAMLPLIKAEIVEKRNWCTEDEILNYFAIGQCTPGIIAINTATFIGYKTAGIIGGVLATIGIILPSLVIILIIANILTTAMTIPEVKSAFEGIRIAVSALIANTVYGLAKRNMNSVIKFIIAISAFIAVNFLSVSSIIVTVVAAFVGILFLKLEAKKNV